MRQAGVMLSAFTLRLLTQASAGARSTTSRGLRVGILTVARSWAPRSKPSLVSTAAAGMLSAPCRFGGRLPARSFPLLGEAAPDRRAGDHATVYRELQLEARATTAGQACPEGHRGGPLPSSILSYTARIQSQASRRK
jgi:hypothetical protein